MAIAAIRSGDVEALRDVLRDHPELVNARPDGKRTLLHVATDWPGNFPNVAAVIATLVSFGADVNARFEGEHSETPLHWAASSNDVAAVEALLDHGADIEAPGGVIGGGTPLADAVAFGQWEAARRLVERGAATTLWQAAALGLMPRVEAHYCFDASSAAPLPTDAETTAAFWCACYGGQLAIAQYLWERGADVDWVGYDGLRPLDAACRSGAEEVVRWLRSLGARSNNRPF
jgi:ankyrin repeat protein